MPDARALFARTAALAAMAALPLAAQQAAPRVTAASDSAAGAYLAIIANCHDCHTQGWTESGGKVPPADQFTGTSLGYRGPWGTSYAANLRIQVARQQEDRWVKILTTNDGGEGRLPMPYHNTALMSDADLRAIYRYIKTLGPKGERVPRAAKPDSIPKTPYLQLTPVKP